jgi:hypothetical protein
MARTVLYHLVSFTNIYTQRAHDLATTTMDMDRNTGSAVCSTPPVTIRSRPSFSFPEWETYSGTVC